MTFTIEDSRKLNEKILEIATGVKAISLALENFWSAYCADIAQIDSRLSTVEEEATKTSFHAGTIARIQGLIEGIGEGMAARFNTIDSDLKWIERILPRKRKFDTDKIKPSKEGITP